MPTITLQFVAEKKWYSPVIRWFSHGSYSHVDIVGPDGLLYGSRPSGGVAARPWGYIEFTAVKSVDVSVSQQGLDAAWAFIKSQVGKPYDFANFLSFFVARDWHSPDRWICSELAAVMLERAGVLPKLQANKITPADLALVLSVIPHSK